METCCLSSCTHHIFCLSVFLSPFSLLSSCFRPLVPLLTFYSLESVDDDDCILQALAEQLGDFVEYVGGPEYVPLIITPLEMLAAAEDNSVRNKVLVSPFSYFI